MGYMGFGMRQWISNIKPKPYFGRRNNPVADHNEHIAGHSIQDFYHLKQNKLENLNQRKTNTKYLLKLRNQMKEENKRLRIRSLVIIAILLSGMVVTFIYLGQRFDLF